MCINYVNVSDTISEYNDDDFSMHFRLKRQQAISFAQKYQDSEIYKEQSGQYGKLDAFQQVGLLNRMLLVIGIVLSVIMRKLLKVLVLDKVSLLPIKL